MQQTGISPQTLKTLKLIADLDFVKGYYLAGGTACALHLGHRLSYDLDFFSTDSSLPEEIRNFLLKRGHLEIYQNEVDTFNGSLNGTKLSFFKYPYPLLQPLTNFEGIKVASLPDLACMKLEAIASRGVKRDFIDLYFILKWVELKQAAVWFEKKYSQQNISFSHVLKSLVYFDDAESDPLPKMLKVVKWEEIKLFFRQEVKKWMEELK